MASFCSSIALSWPMMTKIKESSVEFTLAHSGAFTGACSSSPWLVLSLIASFSVSMHTSVSDFVGSGDEQTAGVTYYGPGVKQPFKTIRIS